MKYIGLLFLLLTIYGCSTSKVIEKKFDSTNWIEFNWVEAEISGQKFSKAVIELPIKLNAINQKLSLQLDIGSQQSFVNQNSIKHLQEIDKSLSVIDTIRFDEKNSDLRIENLSILSLNGVSLKKSVSIEPDEGDTYKSDNEDEYFNIGTLGADAFKDKILIIDYPNQKIAVLDSLPINLKADFVQSTEVFGKLNIPFEFNGETEFLLFDTGSSIFEVATTPQGYKTLNGEKPASSTLQVPSFGTMLEFKGAQSKSELKIGSRVLKEPFVYYSENENVISFFEESNIFGITGNALFLENIVIINYKNKTLGVKK